MVDSLKTISRPYLLVAAGAGLCIFLGALGGIQETQEQPVAAGSITKTTGGISDATSSALYGEGQFQQTYSHSFGRDAAVGTGQHSVSDNLSEATKQPRGLAKQAAIAAPAVEFLENGGFVIELPSVVLEESVGTSGGTAESTAGAYLPTRPQLPIAVALAADAASLPADFQQDVRAMADDFARDLNATSGVVDSASAGYAQSWSEAVARSDAQFKMKYGRVAYIRLNLLMAQEAAISAY